MPKGACTQQALHSAESSRQDDWAGGVEAHARSRQETPLEADSCKGRAGDAACGMQRGLCREDNSSRVLKNGKPERCESQVQRAATHHAKTLPKDCRDAWVFGSSSGWPRGLESCGNGSRCSPFPECRQSWVGGAVAGSRGA
eukprot:6206685-Pleurochrysis_carterae.AAC.1